MFARVFKNCYLKLIRNWITQPIGRKKDGNYNY